MSASTGAQRGDNFWDSEQFHKGRFRNSDINAKTGGNLGRIMYRFLFEKRTDPTPVAPIPLKTLTLADLEAQSGDLVVRLGHSTVLLRLSGEYWLTDPVFADRASPVQWIGPKRFHQNAMAIDALPELAGVILSHDHYDHLDKASVQTLAKTGTRFYTPLGVGQRLIQWGVDSGQVTELDWWQSVKVGSVTLVATPGQHFSGRGLTDGNSTLWASWVIMNEDSRVFFSGDSGYFAGFAEVGERYGPFDLTLIETGAYDRDWADIHMTPEQSVQAHRDLKGNVMIPIHNSTFDLALHAWYEPMERALAEAERDGQTVNVPMMGEILAIGESIPVNRWWRSE
ncbi:MBL fold metallo-hydrolase [Parendozoicomonas haliclonae]|uniref:Metal-dependent hydrolase n=1 Tax=Parendozoicomonas haliclonae TaxID=1960125 RepID=A0A1X7AH03_9GAMM|nr:MBL fold metallo-hydrolase [Parendozoicomonas haliclonae]SMA39440.1 metal-dependent hydrolase [Parendozoicomonas haliclonae]